jgi:hypothetical protein
MIKLNTNHYFGTSKLVLGLSNSYTDAKTRIFISQVSRRDLNLTVLIFMSASLSFHGFKMGLRSVFVKGTTLLGHKI